MRGVNGCSLLLAAILALGAWEPARTEIYKCVGADGNTLFTGDLTQCPGAERHESTGRLETAPTQPRPSVRRPPARLRGRATGSVPGDEALWRGKKLRAETELRDLEGRLEYVRRAVGWCNRGHALYAEDETGIRSSYDCRKVQNEYEEVKARLAGLRVYLDEGLEEECRRSGCLPGWIR
jgi:hypothetical protein